MRKFATIDCETDPFLHNRIPTPFIWGFYSDGFYKQFYSTNLLIEYIKEFDGVIYAHNGGKFDFHFLLDALEPEQEIMIINGRLAKFKIGKAEMRDSYLLLPVPLAAYKKDEFDYTKLESRNREKFKAEIEEYLFNDCKYLYDIIQRSYQDYGVHLTLAGSAFSFWHKNYSQLDSVPRSPKNYFKFFRPYYYGGRVECFKKGIISTPFKYPIPI